MNAQRQLLALLNESFSTTELRDLLIALGIDPDGLAAPDTARNKLAQETILYFRRRKRLADLADEMHRQRPELAEELTPFLSGPISAPVAAAVRTPVAPTPVPSGTGEEAVDTRPWAKPLMLGAGILALVILGLLAFQIFYIPPDNMEADNIIVRVFDAETMAPLERAKATLMVGGSAPRVAYSDTEGVAVIQRLGAQGGGQLIVELEGYEVYERNLPDDLNTAVDVRLERNE